LREFKKDFTPTSRRFGNEPFLIGEQKERNMAVKRKAKARKAAKPKAKRSSGLTQLNYSLSPELAEIVGAKKSTRPQVVKKLWVYIKAKKLQDSKNRRLICPDKKLSEVLGSRPIDMLKMAGAISKHLKKA
jgi:chromatin remodeling complex protein RSC6